MNNSPKSGRVSAPSVPKDATPLALVAFGVSALVIVAAWAILWNLHRVLLANGPERLWVNIVSVLAGLLTLSLLVPVFRSWSEARQARSALSSHDLITVRVKTAEAREWAQYAIGYAVAVLLVFVGVQFLLANDGAVAATFFKLELIGSSFGLILQAFWKNVWMFCVAEVFILVWGLIIAVARMIPGRAGQPIRFLAIVYTDAFRGLPTIISIYLIAWACPWLTCPGSRIGSPSGWRFWPSR